MNSTLTWQQALAAQDWQGALDAVQALESRIDALACARSYVNIGMTARNAGQHAVVIAALERAQALFPSPEARSFCHAHLAESFAMLENYVQAERCGKQAWQARDAAALAQAPEKCLLSYSLYGGKPEYCEGMVLNAELMPQIYPGWHMRVYHDASVPSHTLTRLQGLDVQLVDVVTEGLQHYPGTFWRFAALADLGYAVVCMRDADSLISLREKALVDEWLNSPQAFHIIRDWYSHTDLMLAGLWGVRNGLLGHIRAMMDAYLQSTPKLHPTHADQEFLATCIWPRIAPFTLHHSSCFALPGSSWPESLPTIARDEFGKPQQLGSWILTAYESSLPGDCLFQLFEGSTRLAVYQVRSGQKLELPRLYRQRIESGRYRLTITPYSVSI